MLSKLAYRNALRSMKDYLIYIITMTIISTLMMGFNAMLFSKDVVKIYSVAGIMAVMMGLISVFILVIVTWLIHYMIRFMMRKRSKEFGTYLILGMNKKQINQIFIKENLIMGGISFITAILPAIFLQQVLTGIYYGIFEQQYQIKLDFSILSLLLSFGLYSIIYLFALRRVKKAMKRMTIREFMNNEKQNEEIPAKGSILKRVLFYIGCANIIIFMVMLYQFRITIGNVFLLFFLLILGLYFIYFGLSAKIINQIQKRRPCIYQKDTLFVKRQFASKLRSMQFTMGTITILFVFTLLGCLIAMMFSQYQSTQLKNDVPFDLLLFSDDPKDDFQTQKEMINDSLNVTDDLVYRIYEDGSNVVNELMYEKLPYFRKGMMLKKEKDKYDTTNEFFDYDTYMCISDYNKLRSMLGYQTVKLSNDQYLVHIISRTSSYVSDSFKEIKLTKQQLSYAGMYHESFSQTGMNGADYIIIVPDKVTQTMRPFYSLYAAAFEGEAPNDLYQQLKDFNDYLDEEENICTRITWGYGTSQFISCQDFVLIRSIMIPEMKYVLTSIAFPFVYIALIFVCVALTILAVQQVSDSAKYRFRYQILSKLGLRKSEIDRLILKQLTFYYLLPYVVAVIVSGGIGLFLGKQFSIYSLAQVSWYSYYGKAVGVFTMIYLMYFVVTYHEFRRNVHSKNIQK